MRAFIEDLLNEEGLSMRKIEAITGVSESTLRKYLLGREIRESVEKKIASRLDKRVSDLGDNWVDTCTNKHFIINRLREGS